MDDVIGLELDAQALGALPSHILAVVEDGQGRIWPRTTRAVLRGAYSRLTASRAVETAQHHAMHKTILTTSELPDRLRSVRRKAKRVDPRTTALIVVDVQNGFVNDHSRHAVPAVQRLVGSWTKAGAPVVFARFYNATGSPYERFTGWTRLRSAEEQRIVEELEPYLASAAAVIDKPTSSALTPEFLQLAERSAWTDLVICGIDTDSCVYDTAVAAYHAGYRPWLVTDASASTGGNAYHEAALFLAGRNLGHAQLTTTDEVLCRLVASKVEPA